MWQMAASCITPLPQLLNNHCERGEQMASAGSQALCSLLGALIHIWRPRITDGCDISCPRIWQEILHVYTEKGRKLLERCCPIESIPS